MTGSAAGKVPEHATDGDGRLGKRVYIKTWGCQMNAYDSARMADVLAPLGYDEADGPDSADPGAELCKMLTRHGARVEVALLPQTLPRVSGSIRPQPSSSGPGASSGSRSMVPASSSVKASP